MSSLTTRFKLLTLQSSMASFTSFFYVKRGRPSHVRCNYFYYFISTLFPEDCCWPRYCKLCDIVAANFLAYGHHISVNGNLINVNCILMNIDLVNIIVGILPPRNLIKKSSNYLTNMNLHFTELLN